uniref:Cellulase n=1 Tax=Spirotrichonympha leidyi TaxID=104089 RepID=Q5DWF1_9EUKA|nr:cellulase [Spirotrichonympha leidyi]
MFGLFLVFTLQGIVDTYGALSVSGSKVVGKSGSPAALHGVSFGWHNWWPEFYTADTVKHLAEDWKATVLRAAIGVEPDGGYLQDSSLGDQCATTVADAAIANGIYVILDWHQHRINQDAAIKFFTKFVTKYKGVPNVIYEIFNEPESATWPEVKQYANAVIKVIRDIDPDALVLVGCANWDQKITEPAADPLVGFGNVAYTLHFYAATHTQWLRDDAQKAIDAGLPIFVSECGGMESSGDGAINQNEWNNWISFLDKNSISWVAWSISNKAETCSMITTTGPVNPPWPDSGLSEWGKLVKKLMISIA